MIPARPLSTPRIAVEALSLAAVLLVVADDMSVLFLSVMDVRGSRALPRRTVRRLVALTGSVERDRFRDSKSEGGLQIVPRPGVVRGRRGVGSPPGSLGNASRTPGNASRTPGRRVPVVLRGLPGLPRGLPGPPARAPGAPEALPTTGIARSTTPIALPTMGSRR